MDEFSDLLQLMRRLRKECPWDRKQDLQSLRSFLLEEAYECVEAINEYATDGFDPLIEELGDVLLQVIFQAEILSEILHDKVIEEIIVQLKNKLIRRHPHVFEEEKCDNADAVKAKWDEIKQKEKPSKKLLDLPKSLTALQAAYQLGKIASKNDFDWASREEVEKKVREEMQEMEESTNRQSEEEELGDLLFCLAQWARIQKIDPEVALNRANQKFKKRFQKMHEIAERKSQYFKEVDREKKEELWQEAKRELKAQSYRAEENF